MKSRPRGRRGGDEEEGDEEEEGEEKEDEEEEEEDDDDDDRSRLKIGPRTPPGVHPTQFFTPDRFPTLPGPESGLWRPKTPKNLLEPRGRKMHTSERCRVQDGTR